MSFVNNTMDFRDKNFAGTVLEGREEHGRRHLRL